MLEELKKKYNKMICLEVEVPNQELAKRRVAFYERNGFFFHEYPYIQPAMSKQAGPIPLCIMTTQRKLTEEEFEKVKLLLYKNVYHIQM